jgi:hypothetical protein
MLKMGPKYKKYEIYARVDQILEEVIYIFALLFCESLLWLLFLGRRWKWAHCLPILTFPGGFAKSLEGLIFGGVTNWIIVPFENVWYSCSLGDIFLYLGLICQWIVIVKIETIRYKCRRQQSDALNGHNLKIPDSVDERL